MSKLLVNIDLDDQSVEREFKSLHADFERFVDYRPDKLEVSAATIIRYIVWCYDPESDVVEAHRKWTDKKKEAADLAGLIKNNKLTDDGFNILYGKNNAINHVISRYIWLLYDRDFALYAAYQEMLIKATTEILTYNFDKPSDASKAKSNVEELIEDITRVENKLLSGGDVKELTKVLAESASKFTVDELRPENIVSKLEKKEEIVDEKPYGNYEPEPQRFLNDE